MAEKCALTNDQEQMESYVSIRGAEVKTAFWESFGEDKGLSETGLKASAGSIIKLKEEIKDLEGQITELEEGEGDLTLQQGLNDQINNKKIEIKELTSEFKDSIKYYHTY